MMKGNYCIKKCYNIGTLFCIFSVDLYPFFCLWYCSLAPLVKKVSEARVVEMANKLCDKLLNGKDQHRDIASIALKTVVAEVATQSLAQSILVAVTPQLIKGINGPVSS
jgi:hypothetical protein